MFVLHLKASNGGNMELGKGAPIHSKKNTTSDWYSSYYACNLLSFFQPLNVVDWCKKQSNSAVVMRANGRRPNAFASVGQGCVCPKRTAAQ